MSVSKKNKHYDPDLCPHCKEGRIVIDKNELVCQACYTVIGLASDSATQRTSGKKGPLGSFVDGVGPEDWKNVNQEVFGQKFKDLQERITDPELDKDILYKFGNIHDLLKTPEHIQKNAQSYFKDFGKKQGFSDEEYIAGCIYAAYRLDGKQPVLLDDISIVTRLPDSSIMRAYKKIIDKLKLTPKPLPAPRVFVPMLLDRIGVNDTELRQKTYDLFDRLAKCGLESNVSNPKHFAAGVIYTADKIGDSYQTVKQYEAANASGTTHGVIRKVYNYLNEKLELGLWRLPGGAVIS